MTITLSIPQSRFAHPLPIEHVQRVYASEKYVLPSDEEERKRLHLQHRVLKRAFENRLILAPVEFQNGDTVLECGTGSGIWLLEAEEEIPAHVEMHGFDIESRLFPRAHPLNTSFSKLSVTSLPFEWDGAFSFVHQRLLVAALQKPDWERAISEMYRVLAIDGWVQLGEVGPWKAGTVTEKHQNLVQALFDAKGLVLDCAAYIPTMLAQAGFANIRVEERSIPLGKWAGDHGADGATNFIGVFRAMKTPILKAGGLGIVRSEQEFDRLLDQVELEWDQTPGADIKFYIFSAQKVKSS
ncbi:S-adenosyl-L-methionine-dependent methyltransferase [Gymnopilus junonius]|uniref:S-adenosyl-L-methionine-dependent methyltransferase n=1 Tax=Gymnopilus junonius TaxID=109634 RepID=A0A9P5NT70_GYMJU|nr:S-adenosyl-L-methionine-dependent methyltransferase [Gymnopilus junonius]